MRLLSIGWNSIQYAFRGLRAAGLGIRRNAKLFLLIALAIVFGVVLNKRMTPTKHINPFMVERHIRVFFFRNSEFNETIAQPLQCEYDPEVRGMWCMIDPEYRTMRGVLMPPGDDE